MLSLSHLFTFFIASHSLQNQHPKLVQNNYCNDKCGNFQQIPFPFYLNTSCATTNSVVVSDSFHLSCMNSTTLYLNISSQSYRILQFLSDGVLVDFPGLSSSCRQYNDLNGFGFARNDYYAVSVDNVVGLYDCEDSSLCKASCETNVMPGCDANAAPKPACCYPLSDHSVWNIGDGFSTFSQYGCRGFSCWVILSGTNHGKRGVKLEWAIPSNSSNAACSKHAYRINATAVESGMRCSCQDGFIGDGFADGVGCLKSCTKDGREAYGKDCYTKRRRKEMAVILAGVLAPVFIIASLIALFCLLKKPADQSGTYDHNQAHFHSAISFRKACRTRLFSYLELEKATKGFEDSQKLAEGTNGTTVHAGVLGDGSHVAVHKVQQCENERVLIDVLSRVEALSAVVHINMARLLGCFIDNNAYSPLVVYEYPANGTLETHLHESRAISQTSLDWFKRLNIAAETASVLAFLRYEISPPIYHHDLKSSSIFLDHDFSVKVAMFGLLLSSTQSSDGKPEGSSCFYRRRRSDVYDMGVILLDIITGSKHLDVVPTVALQKIKSGKLEEMVDPLLNYHEQPGFQQEQIQIVADLAARCLLFGGDNGKLGMMDVARELVHINGSGGSTSKRGASALDETFSNSSLLQMISMSPDSAYVP